jgi:hypothetical protein
LWAVSDLIAAHPQWAGRVSDWLAAFDKVDLGQLRAFAKLNVGAVKVRHGLAALLFGFSKRKWIGRRSRRSGVRRGDASRQSGWRLRKAAFYIEPCRPPRGQIIAGGLRGPKMRPDGEVAKWLQLHGR